MVRFKTEDLKLSYTKMSFIRLLSQLKIPCKREQFILTFVRVQVFTASNVWGGRGGGKGVMLPDFTCYRTFLLVEWNKQNKENKLTGGTCVEHRGSGCCGNGG